MADNQIIGISPVVQLDARPTDMMQLGTIDRVYDETRILFPMVRKSYLEGWQTGDTKPELRGQEEYVRVDWDTALALTANAIITTIEEHGNEAIFSSSYGGWSNAGDLYMIEGREPVRLNTKDAEERGIANGDLVEISNDRGTVIAGAILSDEIRPGVMSLNEGAWPDLDSKGRCNSGLINWITSDKPASGLTQATIANTCVATLKKCEDPEHPNRAYGPPPIVEEFGFAAIDEDSLDLGRIADIVASLYENMDPGERIFYERCTVCYGPRDPAALTQLQWRGITPSMYPRAGLDDQKAALVTDFLMSNAPDANAAVN